MLNRYCVAIMCAAIMSSALAQTKPVPKQVERGRELFLNSPKGIPCATCHTMAGLGNAVGPDLKPLASVVPVNPSSPLAMVNGAELRTASTSVSGPL